VGKLGENTIPVLAHIQNDEEYSECMERIHFWQKKFGLTESVASLVGGKGAPSYSLRVKNETTKVQSSIADVGFGINQLFPVIVQCFYAPKGSLILVEQPEAHLHPRYQADVADFLIDVVDYGNSVVVETHSEHLLLRLQRRIAEKKLSPKYVNIHYFDLDSKGTKPLAMQIDENGYFVGKIPEGFFEEGFREAFSHIQALQNQGGTK
jgi:predicted ATPase